MQCEVLNWSQAKVKLQDSGTSSSLIEALEADFSDIGSLKFYQASYDFGEEIYANGKVYLPDNSPQYLNEIAESKQILPLNILLEKNSEAYFANGTALTTEKLYKPGDIIHLDSIASSLLGIEQPLPLSYINAGARSVYMMSKGAQARGWKRLGKALNTSLTKPTDIHDHWNSIRLLSRAGKFDWSLKLLFFPKEVIEFIELYPSSATAKDILHLHHIEQTKRISGLQWHRLAQEYLISNSKSISTSLYDCLFSITEFLGGDKPGHIIQTNNENAPESEIHKLYCEIYYSPTDSKNPLDVIMLGPEYLDHNATDTYYFSFMSFYDEASFMRSDSLLSGVLYSEALERILMPFLKYIKSSPHTQKLTLQKSLDAFEIKLGQNVSNREMGESNPNIEKKWPTNILPYPDEIFVKRSGLFMSFLQAAPIQTDK